jgi:hypothetical protein
MQTAGRLLQFQGREVPQSNGFRQAQCVNGRGQSVNGVARLEDWTRVEEVNVE